MLNEISIEIKAKWHDPNFHNFLFESSTIIEERIRGMSAIEVRPSGIYLLGIYVYIYIFIHIYIHIYRIRFLAAGILISKTSCAVSRQLQRYNQPLWHRLHPSISRLTRRHAWKDGQKPRNQRFRRLPRIRCSDIHWGLRPSRSIIYSRTLWKRHLSFAQVF